MSELTEDEAVAALEWAREETNYRSRYGSEEAARALLDRVRWTVRAEPSGMWARAARRVGLTEGE